MVGFSLFILLVFCYDKENQGRAPIEKNSGARGETPIEKNVIVVDEQGNEYESTYPKRAKGIVKNGRARYLSENRICLACPPNQLEERMMDENKATQTIDLETGEVVEQAKDRFTLEYVLGQIEKLQENDQYLKEALSSVREIVIGGPGDIGSAEKAKAIKEAVAAREQTNRELLAFYQRLYDDLKPKALSEDILKFQQLTDALSRMRPETAEEILRKTAQQMFVKPGCPTV